MRPYKIPGLRIVLDPRGVEWRINLVADFYDTAAMRRLRPIPYCRNSFWYSFFFSA